MACEENDKQCKLKDEISSFLSKGNDKEEDDAGKGIFILIVALIALPLVIFLIIYTIRAIRNWKQNRPPQRN